jgi:hypothetical protein
MKAKDFCCNGFKMKNDLTGYEGFGIEIFLFCTISLAVSDLKK